MYKQFFLIPVNNGHSRLTKLKLEENVRFELLDRYMLEALFDKSENYVYSFKDFLNSVAAEIEEPKFLVLKFGNTEQTYLEFSNLTYQYALDLIQKIRLFTAADIYINEMFLFCSDNKITTCTGQVMTSQPRHGTQNSVSLEEGDIDEFQEFINIFDLTKSSQKLKEAVSIYNQSFDSLEYGVRIVLLITVLEMLFSNDSKNEISYRVSRNTAIFLSSNIMDYKDYYKKIRDFYSLRSEYVHSGKTKKIRFEDVILIQRIVSKTIIKYQRVEKMMDITQDVLSESGFNNPFIGI